MPRKARKQHDSKYKAMYEALDAAGLFEVVVLANGCTHVRQEQNYRSRLVVWHRRNGTTTHAGKRFKSLTDKGMVLAVCVEIGEGK